MMNKIVSHSAVTGFAGLLMVIASPIVYASAEVFQDEGEATAPAAADQLEDAASEAVEALPEGQERVLHAVVMSVAGRAEWKADEEADWRSAQVDDLLEPGAMIRTGRKSSLALRVGHNSTILVDRGTRMTLPEIVQVGPTLRTAVGLTRGRADFKIDRVGLTNDFSVVTPTSIIAVRGTGYGVQYGGLRGTELFAARTNAIAAIEMRYFGERFSHLLSGGARTSDEHMNPVANELFRTFGPPRIFDSLVEADIDLQLLAASLLRNPVFDQQQADLAVRRLRDHLDLPLFQEIIQSIKDRVSDVVDDYGDYGQGYLGR